MGKGSQAKVYFVLYLAIVVELLIIIVERDEAEEHLHRQNNETMKIVESILSQLYSGSGSEGINTKPQDEITLPAEADMAAIKEIFGTELKTWRQYQIDVGVTDVTLAIKRKEGENPKSYAERIESMLSLANVEDLQYQIFFSPVQNADTIPTFQSDAYIRENNIDFMKFENGQSFNGPNGEQWTFVGAYNLEFDKEASLARLNREALSTTMDFIPVYKPVQRVGNGCAPRGREDSTFYYSDDVTREGNAMSTATTKRSFVINFEPSDRSRAGIYKLRFASRTNRILGVAILSEGQRMASDEETKVNIGTVQLSVKDLKKVAKELRRRHPELDKVPDVEVFSSLKGNELISKVQEFDNAIVESQGKAIQSSDADLAGKIRLYEYICRLVIPGQSVNFDQNRSDFDINIRVQTAKPSTAKPYVSILTDNKCFTNARHVFEIEAGPFKGTNVNRITGRIVGSAANSNISFVQEGGTPERDKKYSLRGTVDRELPAGKYLMEITHEIQGKSEVVRDTLEIYDAGIQEESRASERLARRMIYGARLRYDFIPNSETAIQADRFKTIVTFNGTDKKEVVGYNITTADNVVCKANYNTARVTLVWIQPLTFQQFELFTTEADIQLGEPSVLPELTAKYSGTTKIRVTATGLQIWPPETGLDGNAQTVRLSEPKLSDAAISVAGYQVTRQPEVISGDAENGYTIEFEISKSSGATAKTAFGTVTIPMSVTATHPTNNKTSSWKDNVTISIDYTPGTAATGRPGSNVKGRAPARPAARPAAKPAKR